MTDPDNDGHHYELVMPFVTVTSVGGPHDDDAYVCGYEMGRLDQQLQLDVLRPRRITIQTANVRQADLIAMRYGYRTDASDADDVDGWTTLSLTPGSQ